MNLPACTTCNGTGAVWVAVGSGPDYRRPCPACTPETTPGQAKLYWSPK